MHSLSEPQKSPANFSVRSQVGKSLAFESQMVFDTAVNSAVTAGKQSDDV